MWDSPSPGFSTPEIFVALCVFAIVGIAAVLTKWLPFVCFFKRYRRPTFLQFFTVALLEMSCLVLAILIAAWYDDIIVAVPIYLIPATLSNLLLFKWSDLGDGSRDYTPLKKGLYAVATSLVSAVAYMFPLLATGTPYVMIHAAY